MLRTWTLRAATAWYVCFILAAQAQSERIVSSVELKNMAIVSTEFQLLKCRRGDHVWEPLERGLPVGGTLHRIRDATHHEVAKQTDLFFYSAESKLFFCSAFNDELVVKPLGDVPDLVSVVLTVDGIVVALRRSEESLTIVRAVVEEVPLHNFGEPWRQSFKIGLNAGSPQRLLLNGDGRAVLELSGSQFSVYHERMAPSRWREVGERTRSAVGKYRSGTLHESVHGGWGLKMSPLTTKDYWRVPSHWRSNPFFANLLLTADATHYSFKAEKSKKVSLAFRSMDEQSFRLGEASTARYCWGIRISGPRGSGNIAEWPPSPKTVAVSPDTVKKLSGRSEVVQQIDLDELGDFRRAGTYKVQLIYSGRGFLNSGEDAVWNGMLSSSVFVVEIK